MTITMRSFSSLALGLLFVVVSGCGSGTDRPELGGVSGTVTVDGQPAPGLQVVFEPESGRPAVALTDDSGYYALKYTADASGTKVGPNVVRISTYHEPSDDDVADEEEFEEPLPPRYHRDAPDNPEMQVEIESGSNEFNFDLKSE